jgi:2-hydroxy-6-oxonona-2,4-dienedioate hydrolase
MPNPAKRLAHLLGQAQIHQTRLNGGDLLWQAWPGSDSNAMPLLLIHGGFGSWTHWAANLPGLMRERAVWTLDLPGLGSSAAMLKPYTTAHFARLVLEGWNQLQGAGSSFELAGFSFGAMIGGYVAAQSGERCTRCTLIGASGFGELHVQVPLLPPPGNDLAGAEAEAIHRENLGRLMLWKQQSIDELAVHIHSDNLARHRFRSRALARSNDLADVLPDIPGRLVGLWGDQDATAGGRSAINKRRELFCAAQAEAEFHILPEVGHWAMYEAAERVNRIILGSGK